MSNYNTDGFFSSYKMPVGRDIPSMHTDDIYGARPRQNTLNRNIWQSDFVAETIKNQPNHKSRQESLGLKIKSPLFNDFYYKKLDLNNPTTQKAPPEVIQGHKHYSQPEQQQRPTHEYNDALQNFITNNASTAKRYDNTKVNNHQQNIQNYESSFGQNKSDLIMHIDPGRSIYKSQPFANFQTNKIDDTKDLLRPDNHKFSQAQRLKTYDTFSHTNKFPSLPQSQRQKDIQSHRQVKPMQQSQSQEQIQQFINNSQYMPNGQAKNILNRNSSQQFHPGRQNNYSNNNNIPAPPAPAPQQQFQNDYPKENQNSNQQQPSKSEAILRTQPDLQQYNAPPAPHQQQQPISSTPQQMSNKIDFQPPSQSFASASQMGRKTYKPYNVVTHKRHQQYQPKYELPTNHWDCYDKPQWQHYAGKKDAPRNIFKEKNRNNIKTVDFSTSNNEYGEMKQKYKV